MSAGLMNATIAISIKAKFGASCYPMASPKWEVPKRSSRVHDPAWKRNYLNRASNAPERIMTILAGKIQSNWGQVLLTNAMANISFRVAIWKHLSIWKIILVQKSIISDEAVSIIHREQVYQMNSDLSYCLRTLQLWINNVRVRLYDETVWLIQDLIQEINWLCWTWIKQGEFTQFRIREFCATSKCNKKFDSLDFGTQHHTGNCNNCRLYSTEITHFIWLIRLNINHQSPISEPEAEPWPTNDPFTDISIHGSSDIPSDDLGFPILYEL